MLPSTAYDETLKPVRPLQYVGFCSAGAESRLFVVARIESKDSLGRLWGHWYSSDSPTGEFKEIPWRFGETQTLQADVAEHCISTLRQGGDLPTEVVSSFPDIG